MSIKRGLVLLLLVLLVTSCLLLYFLFRRRSHHAPTPVGWQAHVIIIAGDGSPAFRDSTQPTQAAFADPFGLAVSSDGAVYVADAGENNRIRKIKADGTVTTFAGSAEGFADGQGVNAAFNTPSSLAQDTDGNIYVADTGNNRIRKITPQGLVSTVAGDGTAGYGDGPAAQARFNGPIGVAVDKQGNVYVADTYNDRLRKVTTEGQVYTIAGAGQPGYADGLANTALFDTPCGVVVAPDGSLIIADTGNNRLRKLSADSQVTTLPVSFSGDLAPGNLRRPLGMALTDDGFLYVTEPDRGRVLQIAPDGSARVITRDARPKPDGSDGPRLNQISGIALDSRGDLYVADSANYLVRKLARSLEASGNSTVSAQSNVATNLIPQLTPTTLAEKTLLWPVDPQQQPHEVVATMGEVRGTYNSTDSRDHLHSGLDVFGGYGDVVRAVRSEKVTGPLSNWGFGDLSEGIRVGIISYIHIQVGRSLPAVPKDEGKGKNPITKGKGNQTRASTKITSVDQEPQLFDDPRFIAVKDDEGKIVRIRVKRGTRFKPGDALGTINRMYHVHLNVGPPGAEVNPLSLSPVGFADKVAPVIEKDGIQILDESGRRVVEKQNGRLLVSGRLKIIVDAYDRADMNADRRRLGLYMLGYQVLKSDGLPATGFEQPRQNIIFNRLPPDDDATKLAYTEQSGITVYGSASTRFLYEVTNTVRDGKAAPGVWNASELPHGDYILRIIAADFSGNEAHEGRDLLITVR